jgi:hypothetical protein
MTHDEWYTPDEAVVPLIEDWGLAGRKLWLPFDGPDSAFTRLLSPIADVRVTSFDFFDQDFEWFARNGFEVVSNPPFSIGGKIRTALNHHGIPYRLFTSASHWWKDRRATDSVEYLGYYLYERLGEDPGFMRTAATISDGRSELRARKSHPLLTKTYKPRKVREPEFDPLSSTPEWFYQSDINSICARHTVIDLAQYDLLPARGGFPRITRRGIE